MDINVYVILKPATIIIFHSHPKVFKYWYLRWTIWPEKWRNRLQKLTPVTRKPLTMIDLLLCTRKIKMTTYYSYHPKKALRYLTPIFWFLQDDCGTKMSKNRCGKTLVDRHENHRLGKAIFRRQYHYHINEILKFSVLTAVERLIYATYFARWIVCFYGIFLSICCCSMRSYCQRVWNNGLCLKW